MKPPQLEHRHHPILRLDVVARDGTSAARYRTFCTKRAASVPLEICAACLACDRIGEMVECTVPKLEVVPEGGDIVVGTVLRAGALVVHGAASQRDVRRLMLLNGRTLIGVVDDEDLIIGLIHDHPTPFRENEPALFTMSTAVAIPESATVRAALRMLAGAHLREAPVVAPDGRAIGVFRDVDGLHAIAPAQAVQRRR